MNENDNNINDLREKLDCETQEKISEELHNDMFWDIHFEDETLVLIVFEILKALDNGE